MQYVTDADQRAIDRIMQAVVHAEEKHPVWPSDPLRQAAILVEEAGEVIQATLNMIEKTEKVAGMHVTEYTELRDNILHEVAQTGAMALRYLMSYERTRDANAHAAGQKGVDQEAR